MSAKMEKRQEQALLVTLWVLFGGGFGILGTMLLITGWMTMIGIHNVHAMIWGWVSTTHHTVKHGITYTPGTRLLVWPLVVVSTYLLYQLCELANWGFQSFKRALS